MFGLHNRTKKSILVVLTALFVLSNLFVFSLLRPIPVYAQITIAGSVPDEKKEIVDQILDALMAAALGALVNGASYFMRKFAYDSAKYIASGGKGQGALAFKKGFGTYMKDVALDSAASAIDEFGSPFGLNLCKPPDIRLQVNLQVSLSRIYDAESGSAGPQPRCSWKSFTENWSQVDEMYGSRDALSERFSASLSVTEGDFGTALGLMGKVDRIKAQAEAGATAERNEGDGFKSVQNYISGDIQTPAQVIKKETDAVTGGKQMDLSANQIAGIYGAGAWQILPMAASVFANTLVSTLLQNVMTNGLFPSSKGGGSVVDFYAANINYNRQAAERAFSYLIAGVPQHDITAFDIITEFSSCPDTPKTYNCVMDQGLVQALQRERANETLTIGEARVIDGGLIHENWQLIPPSRDVDNSNIDCYKNAYCYSNIQKLRKARILPLGFEIATMRSDPDKPWTLGAVLDGFGDPNSPYYHLIDPNWILKAPQAQCEMTVDGPQLLSENTPTRQDECADFSTCLAEGDDDKCIDYGYCTQEKNVWHIPGESCPDYYNTCKTYTSNDGVIASYLSRTLDFGTCNVEAVGCRAYSTEMTGDFWLRSSQVDLDLKESGREQVLYFNSQIGSYTCPVEEDGCSEFTPASSTKPLYLQKAPEYLGCYDTDPDTQDVIDWPQTKADLVLLANTPQACNKYASVCIPEEVGCEEYNPVNGGTTINGVVGNNFCSSQCVGYETFKQEETPFEPNKFPLYFIPSHGDVCASQYEGCDEFTNISGGNAAEKLEYYSDLKYCEKPDGTNDKTYYSWEGSESQGYVLKKHVLLQVDQSEFTNYLSGITLVLSDGTSLGAGSVFTVGSPAYSVDTPEQLATKYEKCNQDAYNLMLDDPYADGAAIGGPEGCHALYDSSGEIYYRFLIDTISVSNECAPLRKTNSDLFVDSHLSGAGRQSQCEAKGGSWDSANSQCNRCYNGGFYQKDDITGVGACVYWSIPSEAVSCPSSANLCRRYIGNTGSNVYNIYDTSFEPGQNASTTLALAKEGWTGVVSIEPEATHVGQYSLKVGGNGNTSYDFAPEVLRNNAWYELSFWARGNPQTLSLQINQVGGSPAIFTYDPLTGQNVYAPITTDWQEYTLGPIQFTGSSGATTTLEFIRQTGSGVYFIDHVVLKRIGGNPEDYVFRIKDSWKTDEGYDVPDVCDSTPLDAFPGEQLGCRAYTTRATPPDNIVAFTGFERLCRAQAVGCTPVVDTQNIERDDTDVHTAYNLLCKDGLATAAMGNAKDKCSVSVDSKSYECAYEKGESSCFITGPIHIPDAEMTNLNVVDLVDRLHVVTSTIMVPPNSDTLYLAHRTEFVCSSEHVGCQKMGLEERLLPDESSGAYAYSQKAYINSADHYDATLCTQEQVGCKEYKNNDVISFFKDPKLAGAGLCVYKQNVSVGGVTRNGWFMDGVGMCSTGDLCKNDEDCGGQTCNDIGLQPCYNDYILPGSTYGLWSNATPNYEGYVGTCSSEYNGCTELLDPADTSGGVQPDGKPYYVVFDDRLFAKTGDCDSKVSQKEGCVLFDRTENPNKYFNSAATYADSIAQAYALVPTLSTGDLDTNELIKVERDRECSEWLACRTATRVFDTRGKPQQLCQEYRACDEMDASGNCTHWVRTEYDNERLTHEKYTSRTVGWSNPDYSGYSLYNKYNISNFVYIIFSNDILRKEGSVDLGVAYIAYEMDRKMFVSPENLESGEQRLEEKGCFEVVNSTPVKEEGAVCGFDNGGRCYRQRCLYPIDGVFETQPAASAQIPDKDAREAENIKRILSELEHGICKSYPEPDSPFSVNATVADVDSERDVKSDDPVTKTRYEYSMRYPQFERANICQGGENSPDCSCDYIKIEYKNGTIDYWSTTQQGQFADGICITAGELDGQPCVVSEECKGEDPLSAGECSKIARQGTYYGLKGLCLEYDKSRPLTPSKNVSSDADRYPCLTWLPIQTSASAGDLYNADVKAGYWPDENLDATTGGLSYCLESTSYGRGYYDTDYTTFTGPPLTAVSGIHNLSLFSATNYELGGECTAENIASCPTDSNCIESCINEYCDNEDCSSGIVNSVSTELSAFKTEFGACANQECEANELAEYAVQIRGIFDSNVTVTSSEEIATCTQGCAPVPSCVSGFCGETVSESKTYSNIFNINDDLYSTPDVDVPFTNEWCNNVDPISGDCMDGGGWKHSYNVHISSCYSVSSFSVAENFFSFGVAGQGETKYSSYTRLMKTDDPGDVLYKTMQSWAWKNLGTNTRILRIDEKGGCFPKYFEEYDDTDSLPEPAKNEDNVYAVHSFAPGIDNGGPGDTGTLMHPPRRWTSEYGNYADGTSYNYFMNPYIDTQTDFKIAETSSLSPDIDPSANPYIYVDTDVERKLNEYDIDKIYFIPLSYPDGAEGPNPSILTPNFSISFNALRAKTQPKDRFILGDLEEVGENNFIDFTESIPEAGGMTNYQYMLEQKPGATNELLSYETYNGSIDDPTSRDEVKRRYVALAYNNQGVEDNRTEHPFIFRQENTLTTFPDATHDPFTTACTHHDNNNWIAIGLDFNEDGEFLGYISRWCNGENNDDGERNGIRFAVIAELNDRCTELASVVDNTVLSSLITEDYNKAWTNRVWANASQNFPGSGFGELKRTEETDVVGLTPFGSLEGDKVNKSKIIGFNSLPVLQKIYLTYYLLPDTKLGVPYACTGGSVFDGSGEPIFSASGFGCIGMGDTINTNTTLTSQVSSHTSGNANTFLRSLFKKYYAVFDSVAKTDSGAVDDSNNIGDTKPPQVFALNPYTCTTAGKDCVATFENAFTVNNRNYVAGEAADYDDNDVLDDEDKNYNESPDPIMADGNMLATVQFFGYADDNRMPIRRVMVDWGDGEPITNNEVYGMYKNRKPYCSADEVMGRCSSGSDWSPSSDPYQITCKEDADCAFLLRSTKCGQIKDNTLYFGDASRACKDTYFEFSHEYFCDLADLTDPRGDGRQIVSLAEIKNNKDGNDNDLFEDLDYAQEVYERLSERDLAHIEEDDQKPAVCIFKPRVQILDNWRWCNGTCSGVSGCYSDGSIDKCDPNFDDKGNTFYPWTEYKGAIVVIPSAGTEEETD